MSLIDQLSQPFRNEEDEEEDFQGNNLLFNEENNQENNQVNNQVSNQIYNQQNNQVNNQANNQQINVRQESNNINRSSGKISLLFGFSMAFLCLEITFCTLYVFMLFFALSLARYPVENENKYVSGILGFGIPCAFFPCMIIGMNYVSFKPLYIFIITIILVLGKSGLFAGFFICLYKINEYRHKALLANIFFEGISNILIIINEIVKLVNQKNRNQNNN